MQGAGGVEILEAQKRAILSPEKPVPLRKITGPQLRHSASALGDGVQLLWVHGSWVMSHGFRFSVASRTEGPRLCLSGGCRSIEREKRICSWSTACGCRSAGAFWQSSL